jgi:8-oxo-dGTP diphosphatase
LRRLIRESIDANINKSEMSTSKVTTSAVIVLDKANRVLLLKRGKTAPWEPGKWSLPGGVIDPGESPDQAGIREAYEEVGIRLNQIQKFKTIDSGEGWSVAFFICKDWSGTPELKETNGILENDEMAWASKLELDKFNFVPTVKEAINDYFNKNSKVEFEEDLGPEFNVG